MHEKEITYGPFCCNLSKYINDVRVRKCEGNETVTFNGKVSISSILWFSSQFFCNDSCYVRNVFFFEELEKRRGMRIECTSHTLKLSIAQIDLKLPN